MEYDPKKIELKWQKYWLKEGLFSAEDNGATLRQAQGKKKKYILDMFPYPSGDGLHVGHGKIYTGSDVLARYFRMRGFNVLHPTGFDAFGLPTENSAIKLKIHPAKLTERNVARFREQMKSLGLSYDWSREVVTSDPQYYKWTQWIFLQLFKKDLAYQDTVPINWCPSCLTGLSNEEVVDGKCDRCGTVVEQRPMKQWLLKITAYAERLLEDLKDLDWPEFIIEMQKNWIGRKEGINITYQVKDSQDKIICFTTRPDTNFGATFVVIAPEHSFAQKISQENQEVAEYIKKAMHKTELERMEEGTKKTGAFTGYYAINNLNGREMPIWVSDFVLGHFGTGAVVGVPGHDKRDFEFAKAFDLPIERVVVAMDGDTSPIERIEQVQEEEGTMINSEFLNGLKIAEAKERIKDYMEEKGSGERVVTYSLRDWVFSRQRYWGEPIPIIHCEKCGVVPVPEKDLPVELPQVEQYQPTGTGESPLAAIEEWVNVKCPSCGGMAHRETNTMPQWAGSSWYWLRYCDPKNMEELANKESLKNWLPVDVYVGGAEHAVLHLLYARFWNKVLFDMGIVPNSEPFPKLRNVGLVLGEDGQKMSKSRGNVMNPDHVIAQYGADVLRVYEMFFGPFEGSAAWSEQGLKGAERFLKRVWQWVFAHKDDGSKENSAEPEVKLQKTIDRVTRSTETMRFNTAISALMELLNSFEAAGSMPKSWIESYVLMLSPYAPHMCEELWQMLGHEKSIMTQPWPHADQKVIGEAMITMPVQINGRLRGTLIMSPGSSQAEIEARARELPNVQRYLEGKKPKKIVFVPNRLINFVI